MIDENAWVVEDLEATMEVWLKLGFLPFFVTSLDFTDVRYRDIHVPLSRWLAWVMCKSNSSSS